MACLMACLSAWRGRAEHDSNRRSRASRPQVPEVPQAPEAPRTITIPSDGGRGNIGETVALDRAGEARLPASRYAELKLLESMAWSADSIARNLGALVDAYLD